MTARRAMAIGLGGVLALIAAVTVGNLLGGIVEQVVGEEWQVLHNFVYVNAMVLLALLLGFLFVAALGVGRLAKGTAAKA